MRSVCARSRISTSRNPPWPRSFPKRFVLSRAIGCVDFSTVAIDDHLIGLPAVQYDDSNSTEQKHSRPLRASHHESTSKAQTSSAAKRILPKTAYRSTSSDVTVTNTAHIPHLAPLDFTKDTGNSISTNHWNFEDHVFQSTVTEPILNDERLVDTENYRTDASLWLALLRFRERHEGHAGCWEIYEGMRLRRVRPSFDSPNAEQFWRPFVEAALHMGRMQELWEFTKGWFRVSTNFYDKFYEILIGSCLAHGVKVESSERKGKDDSVLSTVEWYEAAYRWHHELENFTIAKSKSVRQLIPIAVKRTRALETFKKIYLDCEDRNIYLDIIPQLCDLKMYETARAWHRDLVSHGDMPTERLPSQYAWITEDVPDLKDYEQNTATSVRGQSLVSNTSESESHPDELNGRVPSSETSRMDSLCARAFATPGFSPNFVMKGLHVFGVQSVGPLAVQALVQQCKRLVEQFGSDDNDKLQAFADEVALQLENLRGSGIRISACHYNRIIQKLASTRNGELLSNIAASDRHPEVYEDSNLLERIFRSYLRSNDTGQARDLLDILSLDGPCPHAASWDLFFRACIRMNDTDRITRLRHVLETMRERGVFASEDSQKILWAELLSHRERGKLPDLVLGGNQGLNFVTYVLLTAMDGNAALTIPEVWREIVSRYGMMKMHDELERVVFWLGHQYSSVPALTPLTPYSLTWQIGARSPNASDIPTRIDRAFPPLRQAALIEWYFKLLAEPQGGQSKSSRTAIKQSQSFLSHIERWARGVALVKRLKSYGLTVDKNFVRLICLRRLVVLFAPGHSHRREALLTRLQNLPSLRYMIAYLQWLWGPEEQLLQIPPRFLKRDAPKVEEYLSLKVIEDCRKLNAEYHAALQAEHSAGLRPSRRPHL